MVKTHRSLCTIGFLGVLILLIVFSLAQFERAFAQESTSEERFEFKMKQDGTYEVSMFHRDKTWLEYDAIYYESITIPSLYNGVAVTSIGKEAFSEENTGYLMTLEISNNIHTIEEKAFEGQSFIKDLIIPSSVTTIGANLFGSTTNFEGITFLNTNVVIHPDNNFLKFPLKTSEPLSYKLPVFERPVMKETSFDNYKVVSFTRPDEALRMEYKTTDMEQFVPYQGEEISVTSNTMLTVKVIYPDVADKSYRFFSERRYLYRVLDIDDARKKQFDELAAAKGIEHSYLDVREADQDIIDFERDDEGNLYVAVQDEWNFKNNLGDFSNRKLIKKHQVTLYKLDPEMNLLWKSQFDLNRDGDLNSNQGYDIVLHEEMVYVLADEGQLIGIQSFDTQSGAYLNQIELPFVKLEGTLKLTVEEDDIVLYENRNSKWTVDKNLVGSRVDVVYDDLDPVNFEAPHEGALGVGYEINNLKKNSDGTYLMHTDVGDHQNITLYDHNKAVLWTYRVDENVFAPYNAIRMKDGRVAIYGESYENIKYNSDVSVPLVQMLDSRGHLLWENTGGGALFGAYDDAHELSNGMLVVFGYVYSDTSAAYDFDLPFGDGYYNTRIVQSVYDKNGSQVKHSYYSLLDENDILPELSKHYSDDAIVLVAALDGYTSIDGETKYPFDDNNLLNDNTDYDDNGYRDIMVQLYDFSELVREFPDGRYVDDVAPETPVITPSTTIPSNSPVKVSISYESLRDNNEYRINNGEWKRYEGGFTLFADAVVEARATDESGNVSDIARYATVGVSVEGADPEDPTEYPLPEVDPDGPAVQFTQVPLGPTNQNVLVFIQYNDVVGMVDSSWWTSEEGTYIYCQGPCNMVEVTDNMTLYVDYETAEDGWSDAYEHEVTNIDRIAPNTPVITPNVEGPSNEPVTATITYESDADTNQYRVHGKEWLPYTGPITIYADTTLEARAIDPATNVSEVASYTFTGITVDGSHPEHPTVPPGEEPPVDPEEPGDGGTDPEGPVCTVDDISRYVYVAELMKRDPHVTTAIQKVAEMDDSCVDKAALEARMAVVVEWIAERDYQLFKEIVQKNLKWAQSFEREPYLTALDASEDLREEDQPEIDAAKQAIYDSMTAKQVEAAVKAATTQVVYAERYKRDPYLTRAAEYIDKVPYGPERDALQARLDAVLDAVSASLEAGKVTAATAAVATAETGSSIFLIDDAQALVTGLKDSDEKTALQARLDAIELTDFMLFAYDLKGDIAALEDADIRKLLDASFDATKTYSERTSSTYMANAEAALAALEPYAETHQDLYDRLSQYLTDVKAKVAEDAMYARAESVIALAERYKRQSYIDKAQGEIDLLPEGERRDALQARLDAIVL